jgi:uncharacterized protein with PQ loop repeat
MKTVFVNPKQREKIVIAVSFFGIALCAIVVLPFIREMIVLAAENILHRNLNISRWMRNIGKIPFAGIFSILLIDYFVLTVSGKNTLSLLKETWKSFFLPINLKKAVMYVAVLFALYLVAYSSLIRANFSYADDMEREHYGITGWLGWSRYLSEFLSLLLYQNFLLSDISPGTQILALLVLSCSSLLLYFILNGTVHENIFALLATLPVGLSPYFLANMAYKFDSPYIALSVLACIVPFVFSRNLRAFFTASFLGLLCMLMTYQATSGVYIIITSVIALKAWLHKEKAGKEVCSFAITAIAAFVCAFLVFKICFMITITDDYVSNTVLPLSDFFPGMLRNIMQYISILFSDFNLTAFKIEIIVLLFIFMLQAIRTSKRNKILTAAVSFFVTVFIIVFSYGAYLILETPGFSARYFVGFGPLLATTSVFSLNILYKKKHPVAFADCVQIFVVFLVTWNCIVFALSFGNSLADQKRYQEFFAAQIVSELNHLCDNSENVSVQFEGSMGHAPIVNHIAKSFPLVKRMVHVGLHENDKYGYNLLENYAFNANRNVTNNRIRPYEDYRKLYLPVLVSSAMYTIQGDGEKFLIIWR